MNYKGDNLNEIVKVEQKYAIKEADILSTEYSFDEKIEVASKIAGSLQKVITNCNLSQKIGNSQYVTVDGWETLGTMLGCTPCVEEVIELPSDKRNHYVYQATVTVRQGETIISRASAVAEKNNIQTDRPAVYSMAQTRALGKAYRMALGWIMKLAGYESTPAEEMETKKNNREIKVKGVKK